MLSTGDRAVRAVRTDRAAPSVRVVRSSGGPAIATLRRVARALPPSRNCGEELRIITSNSVSHYFNGVTELITYQCNNNIFTMILNIFFTTSF